jgi:hypothetical protein
MNCIGHGYARGVLYAFDAFSGGTSANETVQTATGTGRITGKGSQYTEAGSIGVGNKGKYQETGSLDLSGSKGQVGGQNFSGAKGVTINDPSIIASAITGVQGLAADFANKLTNFVSQGAPTATVTNSGDNLAQIAQAQQDTYTAGFNSLQSQLSTLAQPQPGQAAPAAWYKNPIVIGIAVLLAIALCIRPFKK